MTLSSPLPEADLDAFLGLAPFLRLNLEGGDLLALASRLLSKAGQEEASANHLMNLSIALLCAGQTPLGLAAQREALSISRHYIIKARQAPARARVLMLMAPGDLAANIPLDCLLDGSDIELLLMFADPTQLHLPTDIPEHDALVLALCESRENQALIQALPALLAGWPRPIINAPEALLRVERARASALLADAPGTLMPPTLWIPSEALLLAGAPAPLDYPFIIRPEGSQAGVGLERVTGPDALLAYRARHPAPAYYISPFIDYSGADGLFRKMRIAFIDGRPYASHMAVSENWMIHYLNAGMYGSEPKRQEERAFMEGFEAFCAAHQAALDAIAQRVGLDLFAIDCALTRDGRLLVFEVDHCMVLHAMDPIALFPYKQTHMLKAREAARQMLLSRIADTQAHS